MKRCKTCKQFKERSEFHNTGSHVTKTGNKLTLVKPDCKVCANASQRQAIAEKLNALVPEWKCSKCGYDKCKDALEFHHTETSEKDFAISARWTVSFEKLKKEISKCVLVCANCHREIHATDIGM